MKASNVVALCISGAIGVYVYNLDPTDYDICKDQGSAYTAAKAFVEQRLKSPSTAEFPWMSQSGVTVLPAGECGFRVLGYVDAQNAFGATMRARYVADIEHVPGGNWAPVNIEILEPF